MSTIIKLEHVQILLINICNTYSKHSAKKEIFVFIIQLNFSLVAFSFYIKFELGILYICMHICNMNVLLFLLHKIYESYVFYEKFKILK